MYELEIQPFLLCYFPLFMVILGFIAYAVVTDANARRTYLRRTDTRNEIEQLAMPGGTPPVNAPDMAETPGGLLFKRTAEGNTVGGVLLEGDSHSSGGHATASQAPVVEDSAESALDMLAEEAVTAAPAAAAPAAASGKPDDLRKVEGIGPKMSKVLAAAGVKTFAQLAAKTPDEIRAILKADGVNINANNPETWPEQAALAAAGNWDGLQALQNKLVGGRRK